MNELETVSYIARNEAARLLPLTDLDDLDLDDHGCSLPYVHIRTDDRGRYAVSGHGHVGHDNEGRMPFIVDWLQHRVLPYVSEDASVGGIYRIELHDSYSYLPNASAYTNAMTFARPRASRRSSMALVPDPFQIDAYGGLVKASASDNVPWEQKSSTVFFAGSTTGARDPLKNERIKACLWSLENPDTFFRITNVVQMSMHACVAAHPEFSRVLHPHCGLNYHFRYKYQLNIAGNTCCWSRVPMVMASGSMMINLDTHADMMWYYPLLGEGEHYVSAKSLDDVPRVREWCVHNDGACKTITQNAQRFCARYLTKNMANHYMVQFLEAASENKP